MLTSIGSSPRALAPKTAAPTGSSSGADATFTYNSQDSTVFDPATVVIHNVSDQGGAPANDLVKLSTPLKPSGKNDYEYKEGSNDEVAAETFSTVAHTADVFGKAIGQPINWAFGDKQIAVNYDAGEDFNAYYARDEKSVNFFHGTDPKTNQVIMSGDSGEVVSHETGHAILDSFRPAYFSSFTPDVAAFHESFGDMMGLCMSFQDPRGIAKVVEQTGGDLSKPNIFAETGEQLGAAINDVEGQNVTGGNYVRNCLNDLKWADPSTLPDSPSDPSQLGSEAHNFSRLWTGAFYDVVNGINKENLAANPGNPTAALQATGAEALNLLAELVKGAPQGDFTYRDMANAWIAADKQYNGGKRADLIQKVMTDRGILGGTSASSAPQGGSSGIDTGADDSTVHDQSFTFTPEGMKPLSSVTHPVTVTMGSNVPDPFQGARVTSLVDNDGALSKDADTANRMKQSVANLIKSGRILVTTPGQKLSPKDYFDKDGRPYMGVLRYNNDGTKTIERVKIAS